MTKRHDPPIRIRRGKADDFAQLREIAIAAKAHWGYGLQRVREWAESGDFEPESMGARLVYVAEAPAERIGWASLVPRGDVGWLEDLWIDPSWIGRGIGRLLFDHVVTCARELGARRLEWEAEPNARGFYERMGGTYVRESETTEWGRVLEVFGLTLSAPRDPETRG
jgi:GNAT superfamily N-acetyltransferase